MAMHIGGGGFPCVCNGHKAKFQYIPWDIHIDQRMIDNMLDIDHRNNLFVSLVR
jgi:hypothetical protein